MGRPALFSTFFHLDRTDSNAPFSTFSLVITTAKSVKRTGNTVSLAGAFASQDEGPSTDQREVRFIWHLVCIRRQPGFIAEVGLRSA